MRLPPAAPGNVSVPLLRRTMERFRGRFPVRERLRFDPIQFPRRYRRAADREVVALLAALLAYGKVNSMLAKIGRVLAVLGPRPAEWALRSTPAGTLRSLSGWSHRWTRPEDLAYLLEGIRQVLAQHGSLKAAFLAGWSRHDADLRPALTRFVALLRRVDTAPIYTGIAAPRSLEFLLADPAKGSPLKRWSLFLRWVVRPDDGIDLGLWRQIPTDRLTIPLDVHVFRISRALGLTHLKSPRWEMAQEITRSLRRIDPADPVKFDFSICQMGISGACKGYRAPSVCGSCDLAGICALGARP